MNLYHLWLYLLVASIAEGAPIYKRWDFFDLFGDSEATEVPTPTTSQIIIPNVSAPPAVANTPVYGLAVTPQTQVAQQGSNNSFLGKLFDSIFGSEPEAAQPVAAEITTPPPAVGPPTSVQPQDLPTDLGYELYGETTITTILTVTRVGLTSTYTQGLQTGNPTPAPQQSTSSQGGSFFDWFMSLFSSSSSRQSVNTPSQPIASQQLAAPSQPVSPSIPFINPSIPTLDSDFLDSSPSSSSPIPPSQVSNIESSPAASASMGFTFGLSFQGGSPGKYTGSVNMATATAVNGGSNAGASAANGAKGITYSPYTKSDQCKSASDVASDIAKLSNYDIIRLYSTDCSGIENVLSAMASHQQLFLGVWNIDSVQSELQDIVSAISGSSQGWGVVHTIAIGNERVNDGTATVQDIQNAVSQARSFLKQNAPQYTGPIVSVDTLVAVLGNPQLCEISDYLAVNSHPYWDGGVQPQNSGPWLLQQIAHLQSVCGTDKQVLITETGWPTQGDNYGNCVPSVPNQVAALKSIVGSLGSQAIVFTMFNDYWKNPGPYNVEQHWGIYGDPAE